MTFNIAVCIKQVPNTTKVKIDKKTGTLIRKGIQSIFNPDDKHALEAALQIKDQNEKTCVIVVSMGPSQALKILEESLAMGADRAILLSDRRFAGSDTLATSTILASALKEIQLDSGLDLVFCGRQAIDGDTAQVGPQIAEHLGFPLISNVQSIHLDFNKKKIQAQRTFEEGYYEVESSLPAVITAISDLNSPRYLYMKRIFAIYSEQSTFSPEIWSLSDLKNLNASEVGLEGSPTRVKKTFTPIRKFTGEILQGDLPTVSSVLVQKLKSNQII